jgi:hypothetical protein
MPLIAAASLLLLLLVLLLLPLLCSGYHYDLNFITIHGR